ncbi:MAG: hypothetical protein AB1449_11700 [Chloroflexota bacterium]
MSGWLLLIVGVLLLVMTAAVVIGGIGLGLLAFDALRTPSPSERAEAVQAGAAEQLFAQPEIEVTAPSAPDPSQAIAHYYILLRQAMYDVAWNRTTDELKQANYPGGFPDYVRAWTGRAEIEVLPSEIQWQNQQEASIVAELHDTRDDRIFKNAYRLRYDPDARLWQIVSITSAR